MRSCSSPSRPPGWGWYPTADASAHRVDTSAGPARSGRCGHEEQHVLFLTSRSTAMVSADKAPAYERRALVHLPVDRSVLSDDARLGHLQPQVVALRRGRSPTPANTRHSAVSALDAADHLPGYHRLATPAPPKRPILPPLHNGATGDYLDPCSHLTALGSSVSNRGDGAVDLLSSRPARPSRVAPVELAP